MKFKYLLFGVALVGLTSFTNIALEEEYTVPKVILNGVTQASDGEQLIAKSDCVGCHKMDKKLIGPSYLDIAKKYELNDKNVTYLSGKIIKGGSGVWGAIPMSPHTTLKKEDVKSMVKYILTLKK